MNHVCFLRATSYGSRGGRALRMNPETLPLITVDSSHVLKVWELFLHMVSSRDNEMTDSFVVGVNLGGGSSPLFLLHNVVQMRGRKGVKWVIASTSTILYHLRCANRPSAVKIGVQLVV
jgi:hypothetical protein